MKNLSIIGKGYHSDEKVVGFYVPFKAMSIAVSGTSLSAA
jgi:hypothetical protein